MLCPALTSAAPDQVVFLSHPSIEVPVELQCSLSGLHNSLWCEWVIAHLSNSLLMVVYSFLLLKKPSYSYFYTLSQTFLWDKSLEVEFIGERVKHF